MSKQSIIDRTISLYQKSSWKSLFAKVRFWYAPFIEVEQLLPKKGIILDLGCGEGIFTNFVGLSSPEREVIGIEIDKNRFQHADKGTKNVTFKLADITKTRIPPADAIILFHVLHHLEGFDKQDVLLNACIQRLKSTGEIIIVEIYVRPTLQYFLTWITDHLLVAWFFEKRLYSPIYFRKQAAWLKLLKTSGLFCNIIKPKGFGKPFSNIIFVCKTTKQN